MKKSLKATNVSNAANLAVTGFSNITEALSQQSASLTPDLYLDTHFEDEHENGICAICGGEYTWGGRNPYPVIDDEDSCCCAECDMRIVLPLRVAAFLKLSESQEGSDKPIKEG